MPVSNPPDMTDVRRLRELYEAAEQRKPGKWMHWSMFIMTAISMACAVVSVAV